MKRYKLTAIPKVSGGVFQGAVDVVYDMNGILFRIDFSGAQVTAQIVQWFKNTIPVKVENVYEAFEKKPVIATEVEFDVTFDDFKREYPRKRNTHMAEKYWPKLTSGRQYLAFIGAMEYKKYCVRKAIKPDFIMLPEKFLKEEQWKNEWRNEGL